MKNLKKKLLTMACITGMIGLGYALPAKAFESKIDTNSPVIETVVKEHWNKEIYRGIITTKKLENGVRIVAYDHNRDGKPDCLDINKIDERKPGKSLTGIKEIDEDADGSIEERFTFYDDGSVFYEQQLPDGSTFSCLNTFLSEQKNHKE